MQKMTAKIKENKETKIENTIKQEEKQLKSKEKQDKQEEKQCKQEEKQGKQEEKQGKQEEKQAEFTLFSVYIEESPINSWLKIRLNSSKILDIFRINSKIYPNEYLNPYKNYILPLGDSVLIGVQGKESFKMKLVKENSASEKLTVRGTKFKIIAKHGKIWLISLDKSKIYLVSQDKNSLKVEKIGQFPGKFGCFTEKEDRIYLGTTEGKLFRLVEEEFKHLEDFETGLSDIKVLSDRLAILDVEGNYYTHSEKYHITTTEKIHRNTGLQLFFKENYICFSKNVVWTFDREGTLLSSFHHFLEGPFSLLKSDEHCLLVASPRGIILLNKENSQFSVREAPELPQIYHLS